MDFQPFLQGFQSVNEYLNNLITDINNPSYFRRLVTPFGYVQIDPYANDSHIKKFLNSPTCHHCPYACQSKMKFEKFQAEIQYVVKVFHAKYKKFLIAIDHIDYHPSQTQSNVTRVKRSEIYNMYGCITILKPEY